MADMCHLFLSPQRVSLLGCSTGRHRIRPISPKSIFSHLPVTGFYFAVRGRLWAPATGNLVGKHEHEICQSLCKIESSLGIIGAWQRGILVRVSLIVRVQANLVGPLRHFVCDKVIGSCLIDPGVERPFSIVPSLQHCVHRTAREYDGAGRCVETCYRLAEIISCACRDGFSNCNLFRPGFLDRSPRGRRRDRQDDSPAARANVGVPVARHSAVGTRYLLPPDLIETRHCDAAVRAAFHLQLGAVFQGCHVRSDHFTVSQDILSVQRWDNKDFARLNTAT
jgi:hypothetical protein